MIVCDSVFEVCIFQLVQTRLIDAHVFLSLEMDGNLDAYYERRRTVVQVSTLCSGSAMCCYCMRC